MSEWREELATLLIFCPGCFATNEDGSWNHTADEEYCYNCGSGGTVKLPRWAVKSIRQQASWVGKRYYPHDEDREAAAEIAALRQFAPLNPHDEVEYNAESGSYSVYRLSPDGKTRNGIMPIYADSPEEARAIAHTKLRYVPLESYALPAPRRRMTGPEQGRERRFYSFSGGVESTTLALLFGGVAVGITADTGWEHDEMYERWDTVERELAAVHGEKWQGIVRLRASETLPEYIQRRKFFPSPRMRYCTRIFKIEPIDAYLRDQGECELMIGLNADEAHARTGNHGLLANVRYTYPLVDFGITRTDCLAALEEHGLAPHFPPYMQRGGCVGCFFKRKEEFRAMVHLAAAQIEGVAALEDAVQDKRAKHYGVRDGIPNLRRFIEDERSQSLPFDTGEIYRRNEESIGAPCGVFCHR